MILLAETPARQEITYVETICCSVAVAIAIGCTPSGEKCRHIQAISATIIIEVASAGEDGRIVLDSHSVEFSGGNFNPRYIWWYWN